MRVNADTITDDQIRELRRMLRVLIPKIGRFDEQARREAREDEQGCTVALDVVIALLFNAPVLCGLLALRGAVASVFLHDVLDIAMMFGVVVAGAMFYAGLIQQPSDGRCVLPGRLCPFRRQPQKDHTRLPRAIARWWRRQ